MKAIKVLVSLAICMTMILSVMCVGSAETQEIKTVRFANWWGEGEVAVADEFFKTEFTPESGIAIEFDTSPFDGFVMKMIAEIAAGAPADLILCNSDMVSTYAQNGLMLNLDELLTRDGEDFNQFYGISDWTVNGSIYGLPSWYGAWYFYVNVTMLENAGIEVPRDSWTWDELREICIQVADPENGIYGLVDQNYAEPNYWYMLNGGNAFSDDMSQCLINSDEVVEAMEFMRSMIYDDGVVPQPSLYATTAADQMFRDGKTAFMYNGTWAVAYLRQSENIDFEWDVIYAPTGPSADGDVTPARSSGMFIPANCSDIETAWNVMKFWASDEGIANIDINALSSMPSSVSATEAETYNHYPEEQPASFNKEFITEVTSRAIYFPWTHYVLGESVTNAMNSLSRICVENADAKTICDEAYNTITANMAQIQFVG